MEEALIRVTALLQEAERMIHDQLREILGLRAQVRQAIADQPAPTVPGVPAPPAAAPPPPPAE